MDVVLNCSSVDMFRKSYACIVHFGRYIDCGKPNLPVTRVMDEETLDRNMLWASASFPALCEHQPLVVGECMKKAMAMVENVRLHSLPHASNTDVSVTEASFTLKNPNEQAEETVTQTRDESSVGCLPKS